MQEFPHHYSVSAVTSDGAEVELRAEGLPNLRSASPAEFGGPGDRWSPETLLIAAIGDCFLLTFTAIARTSRMAWTGARCDVVGTLERVDRAVQFTHYAIRAHIEVPPGVDPGEARRLAEKAERTCLITNSLKGAIEFSVEISTSALTGA
jgi:organic hydroperoxide reductase OsmC/OhrA